MPRHLTPNPHTTPRLIGQHAHTAPIHCTRRRVAACRVPARLPAGRHLRGFFAGCHRYWREQTRDIPTLFHSMHSKDHFATNVAVAGGLLLLQHDGGGKYTLDSYLKKKD